ncbi:hypothetical protein [Leadbetterella sp. DM7]|uniref:hypothetical protein n=1 Tax=Leadbetterella sp. DM7 TaxID=3235085 RepID=UPI00349EDFEC
MISIARILKTGLLSSFLFLYGCSDKKENDYLKNKAIQNKLDKAIASALTNTPYPDYVTVYFTESGGKGYIFITPHVSIENIRSKYYFEAGKKLIIIGYKSENIENKFAKLKSSKPEKTFNSANNMTDIYDGKQAVFEILNDNSIQEITPTVEVLELNDYGLVQFVPPDK